MGNNKINFNCPSARCRCRYRCMDINSNNFRRITESGGERTFTLNARIDF